MTTRKTRDDAGRAWAWWSMAAAAVVFGASLSVVAQQRRPAVAGAGQGGGINGIGSSEVGADFSPKEPVKPLSPKDEQARFILPPGYHLELVMSEPQIISPGAIAFDGNGRMFVAELRSYMLDADATAEKEPTSRISMHESTKGDGVYDRHTVFVDKVSTPRFVTPLDGNAILTMETDTDEIYKYTDTDNDGVADKKELFYKGAGRIGQNLEHQPSGFIWAHGQLDLQHLQRVPPAVDAEGRGAEGDDGAERRPVGPDPGRLRQGVVRRRRRRARPDQLPDADPVRRLQRRRSVRRRLARGLAGLHGRPRRHAGRHGPRPHAGRRRSTTSPRPAARTSSAATACPTICAATCCSPSRSAA